VGKKGEPFWNLSTRTRSDFATPLRPYTRCIVYRGGRYQQLLRCAEPYARLLSQFLVENLLDRNDASDLPGTPLSRIYFKIM